MARTHHTAEHKPHFVVPDDESDQEILAEVCEAVHDMMPEGEPKVDEKMEHINGSSNNNKLSTTNNHYDKNLYHPGDRVYITGTFEIEQPLIVAQCRFNEHHRYEYLLRLPPTQAILRTLPGQQAPDAAAAWEIESQRRRERMREIESWPGEEREVAEEVEAEGQRRWDEDFLEVVQDERERGFVGDGRWFDEGELRGEGSL